MYDRLENGEASGYPSLQIIMIAHWSEHVSVTYRG